MVIWLSLLSPLSAQGPAPNLALELDGRSSYLDLGDKGPVCGAEFTLEAAVFLAQEADDGWHGVLGGSADPDKLNVGALRPPSLFIREFTRLHGGYGDGTEWHNLDTDPVLAEGAWNHLALVCNGRDMQLIVNGQQVLSEPVPAPPLATPIRWIGKTDSDFHGMLDEVRVWSSARTVEQIQETMAQRLTGKEPGLTGLWNFDNRTNPGQDISSRAAHGKPEGRPLLVEARVEFGRVIPPVVITGKVTNDYGQPEAGLQVRAMAHFRELRRTETNADGEYRLSLRGDTGRVLVLVLKDSVESQRAMLEFKEGGRLVQDFQIKLPASVAGRVLDTQDRTQPGVIVELTGSDGSALRTVTAGDGAFAFRHVVPGKYRLRAQAAGGFASYADGKEFNLEPGAKLANADILRAPRIETPQPTEKVNNVLLFGAEADSVALPDGLLAGFDAATVECWVRWDELRQMGAVFGFGDKNVSIALEPLPVKSDLAVVMHLGRGAAERLVAPGVLREKEWTHLALAMQGQEVTLYLNGVRVAEGRSWESLKSYTAGSGLIGCSPWYRDRPMYGAVDEFRIWAARRTQEQIMALRDARLRGDEDGLLALYQYDDETVPGHDSTPRALHATAGAGVGAVAETLPAAQSLPAPLVITGMVTDPDGRALPRAEVRITTDGTSLPPLLTDDTGTYLSTLPAQSRTITLSATSRELACPPRQHEVKSGENSVDLALRDSASLSGRTLALDDSPLPNVVVQAVSMQGRGLRPGLLGEFTRQTNLTAFNQVKPDVTFRRVDGNISFPLANHSIGGAEVDTAFYVRWSGRLRVTAAGTYKFHLQANDRARLSIGGREIMEASSPLTGTTPLVNTEVSGMADLSAGDHEIAVEYLNRIGREGCELSWTPPGSGREVIPATALWHEPSADQLLSTTVSNARGHYRFPILAPGDYQLRAHTAEGLMLLNGGRSVNVKRSEPRDRLDFRLPPFKKGVWRRYSISDGLASDMVNCTHVTPEGAMWFGTQGGATRFDGREFITLSEADGLANSNVYAVLDEGSAVWFGTMNGLTRWQPGGAPAFQSWSREQGLAGYAVKALHRDRRGTLWALSDTGLARLEGSKFVSAGEWKLVEGSGVDLHEDRHGVLWCSSADGVHRVQDGAFVTAEENEALPREPVISIAEDEKGILWFALKSGLMKYDPAAKTAKLYTQQDGLCGGDIHGVCVDSRGRVWAGSYGGGVSCFDGQVFVNYRVKDGLPDEQVVHISADRSGALWFATRRGVAVLDFDSFQSFSIADGLDPAVVRRIASTSDGSVWFLADRKLTRWDGRRFSKISAADGLPGTQVSDLWVDADGALLVSDNGTDVARFKPGGDASERPRFEVMEGTGAAGTLLRTPTGELWLAGSQGLRRYESASDFQHGPARSPLRAPGPDRAPGARIVQGSVLHMQAAAETLWIVSADREAQEIVRLREGAVNHFTVHSSPVEALYLDADGTPFTGSWQGIAKFDGTRFVQWPDETGRLAQTHVQGMTRGPDGLLRLSTRSGLITTDGTAFMALDERDGLPDNRVQSAHVTANGTVWLGMTTEGSVVSHKPPARFSGKPRITLNNGRDHTVDWPSVTAGQHVTFKFGIVDLHTVPAKRQFRWRIYHGARDVKPPAWSGPSEVSQIGHHFDLPGTWTIAVQYLDRHLHYSDVVEQTVSVTLPWHANKAIMIPAWAGVGGLLGWAFIARVLYVRKRRESDRLREQLLAEEHKAREAAEAAADAAQVASLAKSQFLANMSHELRTPMNAIIGYSEMLQEEAEDSGNQNIIPDLQKIHGAGKHLLGLINDILDLSKIEAGKMTLFLEDFDVAKMISEVAATVQPLVAKNNNKLVVECPYDIGTMHADLTKVRQTLFNLLSNASKFTENGTITLHVGNEEDRIQDPEADAVKTTATATPDSVFGILIFRVADTGIGISPDAMNRLFQAFEQADASTTKRYGGTGLGLAISKKFCQMMGGDISVQSMPGVGTEFTVTLPAHVRENNERKGQDEPLHTCPEPHSAAPAILTIDDDHAAREILHRALAKEGYRVLSATDGPQGLAMAHEHQPAVITLDVMMPGMDGWAVLTALKSDPATSHIPVVMMTMVDNRGLGFALGAADYFTKPIDWHRLSAVLRKFEQTAGEQRVLIVEDDPAARDMLCRGMQKENWQVKEAANGKLGLAALTGPLPHLILLDLMMPEMDGFTFMEELRRMPQTRHIPVIVITAKILTEEDRHRLNGEVSRILQKRELSPAGLLAEIRSLLPKIN